MIPGIILAAGESRRFLPQHKLLQPFKQQTILYHSVKASLDSDLQQILLIVGHRNEEIIQAVSELQTHPKLQIIFNEDWATGRASSLRIGIENLPNCNGVLVYPGDMPLITNSLINDLIQTFDSGEACFPVYNQRKGHPVVFPKEWFSDLKALQGDQSALGLIKAHWENATKLERTDIETQLNVNTPKDYETLQGQREF